MDNLKFLKVTEPVKGVLLVEMNRPPVNAFHQPFYEELGATFDKIGKNGEIRAVVLSSTLPKIFTAGLDLNEASSVVDPSGSDDPARRAIGIRDHVLHFQSAISSIERCSHPVIGAIHGLSIGLAIDILCACDIRYTASSATFTIKEVDLGLAADIGTLARFPKIIGNQSLARELALTARTFGPLEAKEIGFVSKVVQGGKEEVVAAALETAALIASKSPIAVFGTKHLLLHSRDHTVSQNLEYTATWNQIMLQSSDTTEAFKAFKTKKPPSFKPLPKL